MSSQSQTLKFKHFTPRSDSSRFSQRGVPPKGRRYVRVPDDQRKRAKQACEQCRQKKERCDGNFPCGRCKLKERVCGLNDSEPSQTRMSLSSVDRAKALERVLTHVLGVDSLNDEELQTMDESLVRGSPLRKTPVERTTASAHVNSSGTATPLDGAIDSGGTSLQTFSLKLEQRLGGANSDGNAGIEDTLHDVSTPATLSHARMLINSCLACFPRPETVELLVRVFFKYVQCNNFYVQEEWLQDKVDACLAKPSRLSATDMPSVATVSMILALGTQFSNMLPPHTTSVVIDAAYDERLGTSLYQRVAAMVPDLIKDGSFESVRACLLIAVYLFPIDLPGLAYTHLGLALHMAIKLGLHREIKRHPSVSEIPSEVRSRVWWTLYTFYQRARIYHGHPRMLSHQDVSARRPQQMQELEATSWVSNFQNQVALIEITIALEDIADHLAGLRRAQKASHMASLLSLRHKLIHLRETLPDLGYAIEPDAHTDRLRLDIHVHLHYWHALLFLGRPFALAHHTLRESGMATPKNTSGPEVLVAGSLDAAFEIISLCEMIHNHIGLARASYATEFTSCRAAMLVLIACSITDKMSHRLDNALALGLELITFISSGHGQAGTEARVIVALRRAIDRLHQSSSEQRPSAASEEEPLLDDPYAQFNEWEMLWRQSSVSAVEESSLFPPNTLAASAGEMTGSGMLRDMGPSTEPGSECHDSSVNWEDVFGYQISEFNIIPDMGFEI